MASLNTLRTKFGIALSVIIAFALLAFILSLKTEMGFSGHDPLVGVINGEKINYSEYYEQYENFKKQNNVQESDERVSAGIAQGVWSNLIAKYVMQPGLEDLGLSVGNKELMGMINGQYPSQILLSYFQNPETGAYDLNAVRDFVIYAQNDPQSAQMWNFINEAARGERMSAKFSNLLRNGVYVNSLELNAGVEHANHLYSGRWISKKYSEVGDSLLTVTESEMKDYYASHKNMFKQLPNRTLTYVVFEVNPTEDDMANLENKVMGIGEEFKATDDLFNYTRGNHYGKVAENYVTLAQLPKEQADILGEGNAYGPALKNNEWKMVRVLDTKMVPDSLGLRQLVLRSTDEKLADSLVAAVKAGADFAAVAEKYSLNTNNAKQGGDLGILPFSAFSTDFTKHFTDIRNGDIVTVPAGSATMIFQAYRVDKPSKHYRLASITYPVVASDATRSVVLNEAGNFAAKAKGSVEAFQKAAADAAITPRTATLAQGERTLRGMEDSRELVRWAFGAEKGDLSQIIDVDKDHVIAIVTDIDDEKVASFDQVKSQINNMMMRDKKYDYIVKELSGKTIEEQAASWKSEVGTFENANYGVYYLPNIGFEPRVIGAIASAQEGVVSAPVKGFSGAYVFCVDKISEENKQTLEGERVRAQATQENAFLQMVSRAIEQLANIEDLRGQYF